MSKISECIIFIYSDFKNNIKTHSNYSTLNEDGLTQHFVEILDNYLFSIGFPFGVKNQYNDTYTKSKGKPDFYFHSRNNEEIPSPALAVFEAKILPTPNVSKIREETEYVFYKNPEKFGGIERFKNEKHGKGISMCGMIAFIKSESYEYWFGKVNEWIEYASFIESSNWDKSEKLLNQNSEFNFHKSKVIRESSSLYLHHYWMKLT